MNVLDTATVRFAVHVRHENVGYHGAAGRTYTGQSCFVRQPTQHRRLLLMIQRVTAIVSPRGTKG
jgi:hypothetical protein